LPSGNSANTIPSQLASNLFKQNSHTDGIVLSLQYSFILDETVPLLKQLFNYGRYGTLGTTVNDICPNMIFTIDEMWSSWGDFERKQCLAKITESVAIENTESDALTIGVIFQIQGENN
jgi:hypothetical protein